MAGQLERVRETVLPAVEAAGYDLEDVSVTSAGRRSVVRVVVDGDGGVDLDAVAEVSRQVGAALDDADALGNTPYVLEVTSPGVDRPLRTPRHWRRNMGRLVATTHAGAPLTGRILAVDDDGVTLEVDGEHRTFPFAELADGQVQVEFSRKDRP